MSHAHSSARKPLLRRTGLAGLAQSGGFGGSGAFSLGSGRTVSLRLFGLAALAATVLLALTAGSAQAAATYQFSPAKTEKLSKTLEEGTAAGYQQVQTLTFDAAGNLYLADSHGHAGESVVDKFDPENAFTAQLGVGVLNSSFGWGVAVQDGTDHIFSANGFPSEIVVMDAAGTELSRWTGAATPASSFSGSLYTAVDNSTSAAHGDIYVLSQSGGGEVAVFESKNEDKEEGGYLRSLEVPPGGFAFGGSRGLAVDDSAGPTAGRVYVADPGNHAVEYFSPTGTFEGKISGPPGEQFSRPVGVAVDPATGDLFVADAAADAIDQFSPSGAFIARITQHLTEPTSVSVQPTGPGVGDLYVSDFQQNAVDVFAIQRPAPPIVEATAATGVTGEAATLLAEVNPQGEATSYSLEYGPCPTAAPCPLSPYQLAAQGTLGSSGDYGSHTVTAPRLTGLAASTTYHFRVVATNLQGQTVGQERTFTTQGAAVLLLPDGRGYELVSPPDKHGGTIGGIGKGVIESAADGSAITFVANEPIEAQPEGNAAGNQVISAREASGWTSRGLATPHQRVTGAGLASNPEYRLFAADLSAALIQPFGLLNPELSPEATEQTPYLRTLGSCSSSCLRPLLTAANTPPGSDFGEELGCEEENGVSVGALSECGAVLFAATPDLSHVVMFSPASLTAGAPEGRPPYEGPSTGSLYEWSRSTGALQLISRLPENGAGEELPAPPSERPFGRDFGAIGGSARRALSADGSRVFWNSGRNPGLGIAGNLYLRDTEPGHEQTLELDLAEEACLQAAECESGGGRFQIASADGSRVFFTARRLTAAAPAEGGLWECRLVETAGQLSCDLTLVVEGAVQGEVLGASEDGSYLYFAASGVLAPNIGADGTHAAPATCSPTEAGATCNLYLAHDGAISFIATLSGGDEADWQAPLGQPTRVSPDGRWLSFMSQQPLTGYDNRDAASGMPDAEIFLYDAASDSLLCASCDPTGARPVGIEFAQAAAGNGSLANQRFQWLSHGWVAALPPAPTNFLSTEGSAYQGRYLSDSGRLFFNALGGLVPADSNGIGDVYEFEQPQGPGQPASDSCSAADLTYVPSSAGCLDLISSGTSKESSAFLDASESGDDVFFRTSQRLASKDVDSANDIYDARVGGGEPEVVKPVECSGDACQQPAVPPVDATPGSLTFQGAGNVVECPKGKKLQKGKCVKQKAKKKHHKKKAKKHTKKRANSKHGGQK